MYPPLCGEKLGFLSFPTPLKGRPYTPNGPSRTGGTRVCVPLCGEKLGVQSYPTPPQGVPIPKNGPGRTGGTRVYLPLCGREGRVRSYPTPPRGVRIPQPAQAVPGGLGCMRRSVGRNWESDHTRPPHGASLSPKRPTEDRRDSGVSAAIWPGTESPIIPDPPRGVRIPQPAQAVPGGLGCMCRSVGRNWESDHTGPPPTGRPYPQNGPARPEGLRCVRRCVGRKWEWQASD